MIFVAVGIIVTGCKANKEANKEDKNLHIGASATPHAEILEYIKPELEKQGYSVDIKVFSDYVKPNQALMDGEINVNFFQHKPYLDQWAKDAGASDKVKSVFDVLFEPLGIYSVKHTSLSAIQDGQKLSIPNDPTNGGRALKLLADNGIITLKTGKGINVTKQDIETYKKKITIVEMQAESVAASIADVDFAVINGNNALNAKVMDKMITSEKKASDAAKIYANIIAVQTKDSNTDKIKALIKALNTENVKTFIEDKYKGIVVPLVPVN